MRCLCAFKPWEIAKIGTRNKARIVDLETSWQQIGHKQTRLPLLQIVDFQNNHVAFILIDACNIGRFAIERIVSALDVETLTTCWQRLCRRCDRRHNSIDRAFAGVGNDQRLCFKR